MAFNNYPHTDYHEMNLDYLLRSTEDAKAKVDGFQNELNKLKDADVVLADGIAGVNRRISNLDFQKEVNNKIDSLIDSGEFTEQIAKLRVTPNYSVFRKLQSSSTTHTDFGIVFCGDSIMASVSSDGEGIVSNAAFRTANRLWYHWKTMLHNNQVDHGNTIDFFQMAWGGGRTSTEGVEWLRQYREGVDGEPWVWIAPDNITRRKLKGQNDATVKPAAMVWNMGANDIAAVQTTKDLNRCMAVTIENLKQFIYFCVEEDIAPFVFTVLPLNDAVTTGNHTTRNRRVLAKITKAVCDSFGVLCCNACEKYDTLVGGGISQGKLIPPTGGNYAHMDDYRAISDAIAADIFPPAIATTPAGGRIDVASADGVFNNGNPENPFEVYTTGINRYLKIYNSSRVAVHIFLPVPSFISVHGVRNSAGGTLQVRCIDSLVEHTVINTFSTSGTGPYSVYMKSGTNPDEYHQYPAGYYRIELECTGGGDDDAQYALVDSIITYPVGGQPGYSRPSPKYLPALG